MSTAARTKELCDILSRDVKRVARIWMKAQQPFHHHHDVEESGDGIAAAAASSPKAAPPLTNRFLQSFSSTPAVSSSSTSSPSASSTALGVSSSSSSLPPSAESREKGTVVTLPQYSESEACESLITSLVVTLSDGLWSGLDLWSVLQALERVQHLPGAEAQQTYRFGYQIIHLIKTMLVSEPEAIKTRAFFRCALNQKCLLASLQLLRSKFLPIVEGYMQENALLLLPVDSERWQQLESSIRLIGGKTLDQFCGAGVVKTTTTTTANQPPNASITGGSGGGAALLQNIRNSSFLSFLPKGKPTAANHHVNDVTDTADVMNTSFATTATGDAAVDEVVFDVSFDLELSCPALDRNAKYQSDVKLFMGQLRPTVPSIAEFLPPPPTATATPPALPPPVGQLPSSSPQVTTKRIDDEDPPSSAASSSLSTPTTAGANNHHSNESDTMSKHLPTISVEQVASHNNNNNNKLATEGNHHNNNSAAVGPQRTTTPDEDDADSALHNAAASPTNSTCSSFLDAPSHLPPGGAGGMTPTKTKKVVKRVVVVKKVVRRVSSTKEDTLSSSAPTEADPRGEEWGDDVGTQAALATHDGRDNNKIPQNDAQRTPRQEEEEGERGDVPPSSRPQDGPPPPQIHLADDGDDDPNRHSAEITVPSHCPSDSVDVHEVDASEWLAALDAMLHQAEDLLLAAGLSIE